MASFKSILVTSIGIALIGVAGIRSAYPAISGKGAMILNARIYQDGTMYEEHPSYLLQTTGPARGLPFHGLLALTGDWMHTEPDTAIEPPIVTVDERGIFIKETNEKDEVTLRYTHISGRIHQRTKIHLFRAAA